MFITTNKSLRSTVLAPRRSFLMLSSHMHIRLTDQHITLVRAACPFHPTTLLDVMTLTIFLTRGLQMMNAKFHTRTNITSEVCYRAQRFNRRLLADGVTQMSDGKMASNPRTAGQRNLPFTARVRGGRVFFTGVFAASLRTQFTPFPSRSLRESVALTMRRSSHPGRPSNRDSIPGFSLLHGVHAVPAAHVAFCAMGTGGKAGRGLKLTTHAHVVAALRMRGAILPVPPYDFMAR
jgi:hypothetical protein